MKVIIFVVFCCVALLPYIHSNDDEEKKYLGLRNYLDETAAKGRQGKRINGIFRLIENGFLGRGGFGVTYKAKFEGEMDYNGKEVALKFTPSAEKKQAYKEYDIYTYLLAIDNPVAESYGIPTIYYFNRFKDYIIMAITLLEPKFNRYCSNNRLKLIDLMITFREFTRITKYIHSCGIRHDDIKTDNIMYDGHRAFIIDYNIAQKMDDPSYGGTLAYYSRRAHLRQKLCAKDDWESFLYSMCEAVNCDLGWFHLDDGNAIYELKKDTNNTLQKIQQITDSKKRNVIYKFAKYVLDDDRSKSGYPNYDGFYSFIERQMESYKISQPAFVSWLTPDQKIKALHELEHDPPLNISKYIKPRPMDLYPPVNRYYFREKYHSEASSSVQGVTSQLERLDTFGRDDTQSYW